MEAKQSKEPQSSGTLGSFSVAVPSLSLPKGGGAIRGIGEKFAANPVTGTGTMNVPIVVSPARNGFEPKLTLSYDSGSGNGAFGFGWNLSVPTITRKTDKGLPHYLDAEESDVFLLSGAEDLVPRMRDEAPAEFDELPSRPGPDGRQYRVKRYRPRIESEFARIERWTEVNAANARPNVFWRSITRDNVTHWYGLDANSRIADPQDATRIFSWLICYSYDDRGNAMVFDYVAEDSRGVDTTLANERNRTPASRGVQRYLRRIRYGNELPNRHADDSPMTLTEVAVSATARVDAGAVRWLFSILFEYEGEELLSPVALDADGREFHATARTQPARPWQVRKDAFSSYRSGFELRTYRRCSRVLMFHHFPNELGRPDYLVRSTEFDYRYGVERGAHAVASFISAVRQRGYRIWEAPGPHQGEYFTRAMPPVEFDYSAATLEDVARDVDAESLRNLPAGTQGDVQWVDLDGEGAPGLLTEQGDAWYYKRNVSAGNVVTDGGREVTRPAFEPLAVVRTHPATRLAMGGAQFLDLAGDGNLDVVDLDGPAPGFYERNDEDGWEPQRPFQFLPQVDWRDPNLRFVDLDGDGHADVLITEHEALVWYPSLGEQGFGPARRLPKAFDDEQGPRVVFADGEQVVMLADLCGHGLSDLVRVRNGDVCYWPNLGYGRFGAKVAMDHAPYFDTPEQFDPRRVQFADVDGSGTGDIVYFSRAGAVFYRNLAGNAWAPGEPITSCPPTDTLSRAAVVDLLGNGTACLVWSSSLPSEQTRPMRYVDLMGGRKPHLLVRCANNLGTETRIEYVSSTFFYLDDERRGDPWLTRLPFPVQVVRRVIVEDFVNRSRFVTRYAYHHGHFDGVEREFRGFSLVEQWDTASLDTLTHASAGPTTLNVDAASHLAPVCTKSWFHTGMYLGRERISNYFAVLPAPGSRSRYFQDPALSESEAQARLLPDTVLPAGLITDEEREACRALKGALLRQEIYAEDGSVRAGIPYKVIEQNFGVLRLQSRGPNRYAVFLRHPLETLTSNHERDASDPRVEHALTLEVDERGNALKQAAVAYGRTSADAELTRTYDRERQTRTLITYTENEYTNAIDSEPDAYRTPLIAETRTYELTGYSRTGAGSRYSTADFVTVDATDPRRLRRLLLRDGELRFEQAPTAGRQRRLISQQRTLYRCNDLSDLLGLHQLEWRALPGEVYRLAFTPGLIDQVYRRPLDGGGSEPLMADPAAVLGATGPDRGGYVSIDGGWWQRSGQQFYSLDANDNAATELSEARRHFFMVRRFRDPFHDPAAPTDSVLEYERYDLLTLSSRDALGNVTSFAERNADDSLDLAGIGIDYRVLKPFLAVDPNRNRTQAAFDVLGFVAGTALMGKRGEALGDSLTGFEADLDEARVRAQFVDPNADPHTVLGGASSRLLYDLDAFRRTRAQPHPAPLGTLMIAREVHLAEAGGPTSRLQRQFSYSDGFGREIQKKTNAANGRLPQRDANGEMQLDAEGRPILSAAVGPRWACSGWTVFNNKGNPVRQYEAFFTDISAFEFAVRVGVSPVLFYDPLERVIATLHPNHAYEKVLFSAWRKRSFDVNDTVAPAGQPLGDPRTDADIAGFTAGYFAALPAAPPWNTWYEARTTGALGTAEQAAATKALAHSNTPTTAYLDALGRPLLTFTHNRVTRNGAPVDERLAQRVEIDILGKQRLMRDALVQNGDELGRVALRNDFDLAGNVICRRSMEAGSKWLLHDSEGRLIRCWDSRGHQFTHGYDAVRRPITRTVRGTTAASDPRTVGRDFLIEQTDYGETDPQAADLNLRGRVLRVFDNAGVLENFGADPRTARRESHDFKGNLLRTTRRLLTNHRELADWSRLPAPALDETRILTRTLYDALNRPVQSIAAHQANATMAVTQPVFNQANLLERIDVWLERATEPAGLIDVAAEPPAPVGIARVEYDPRGEYRRVDFKNGASTIYRYDPGTLRLTRLYTRRGAPFAEDAEDSQPPHALMPAPDEPPDRGTAGLQNLEYTYDPVGNLVSARDTAQPTVYFANRRVDASSEYVYDAAYRLIEATGREHLGQQGGAPIVHSYDDATRTGVVTAGPGGRFAAGDGNALGRYVEQFDYDTAGNLIELRHRGSDPAHAGWTRRHEHLDPNPLDPGKTSNRLTHAVIGAAAQSTEDFLHDEHGNVVRLPHLGGASTDPNLHWDYQDRLIRADLGGGGSIYFVYDASSMRIRKVWEKSATLREERQYLGFAERFVRTTATDRVVRESLHVMDGQRRIALVETRVTDTAGTDRAPRQMIRYQHANGIGSACLELDEAAQIRSYEEYSPYGNTTYQAVRSALELPKRYRFASKERDEGTGLYYFGARYYAPWLMRWISTDPKVDTNLYWYAKDSPAVLKDPDGKAPYCEGKPLCTYDNDADWSTLDAHMSDTYGNMWVIDPDASQAAEAEKDAIAEDNYAEKRGWWGKQWDALKDKAASKAQDVAQSKAVTAIRDAEAEVREVVRLNGAEALDSTLGQVQHVQVRNGLSQKDFYASPTQMGGDIAEMGLDAAESALVSKGTGALVGAVLQVPGFTRIGGREVRSWAKNVLVGISRDQFRRNAARIIRDTPGHPLRKLLQANGKFRNSAAKGILGSDWFADPLLVEAGHVISKKSGKVEKVILMSAEKNRKLSGTIERIKDAWMELPSEALDIEGVAVDIDLANDLVNAGHLTADVVKNAQRIQF